MQSEITVDVTSGRAIPVAVDRFNGATGAVELRWSYPTPAKSGQTYRIAVADEPDPTEFGFPGDFSFDWALAACGPLPSGTPAWVSAAVNWATCLTFVTGYPDGTFRPDRNISRAQTARREGSQGGSRCAWAWESSPTAASETPT